jgi:hypothetical protein
MTNYAQPQGIENWPEDLRRRFLEAMKQRQLELSSQVVGGAMPYGGEAELSPADFAQRQSNAPTPTASSDERSALMQQERLQSLLNQASPATSPEIGNALFSRFPDTQLGDSDYADSMVRSGNESADLKRLRSEARVKKSTDRANDRRFPIEPGTSKPRNLEDVVSESAKWWWDEGARISRERLEAAGPISGLPESAQPATIVKRIKEKEKVEARQVELEAIIAEHNKNAPSAIAKSRAETIVDTDTKKKGVTTVVPPKNTSEYDAYMKSLWGRYASDPVARKKMYLSQLNKIYAKSMLLDGWAHVTGGESRGAAYAAAATDVLDKTEKFDSEIRLHNIWKAAMFKDGKYYPPKTIPDFYERLQALGATASEISELTKGVSGKSFREQASLEATPKAYTYYDKATRKQFYAYENDERVSKGMDNGTVIKITTPTLSNVEGTDFTAQMNQLGKRYKMSTSTERGKIVSEAVRALEYALIERSDFIFSLKQMTEEDFRTPQGKINIVLKLMGIDDPSGRRVQKVPQ